MRKLTLLVVISLFLCTLRHNAAADSRNIDSDIMAFHSAFIDVWSQWHDRIIERSKKPFGQEGSYPLIEGYWDSAFSIDSADQLLMMFYYMRSSTFSGAEEFFSDNHFNVWLRGKNPKVTLEAELIALERARNGTCDELTYASFMSEFMGSLPERVDFNRFNYISACLESSSHWGDSEEARFRFLRDATKHLLMELSHASRWVFKKGGKNKKVCDDVKLHRNDYVSWSVKFSDMKWQSTAELLDYYNMLWNQHAKQYLDCELYHPLQWSHASELYQQISPLPKPEWVAAMKEINSKSLKEWQEEVKRNPPKITPKTPAIAPVPVVEEQQPIASHGTEKNVISKAEPEQPARQQSRGVWIAVGVAALILVTGGGLAVRRKRKQGNPW